MTPWLMGGVLLYIGALVLLILFWDELVDLMKGCARRGHRKLHDVERTRRLRAPRAVARARIPRQRGPRHSRE